MTIAPESTLIVFGGLAACGKSTLASALARRLGAIHLRIDTIEQAIRDSGMEPAAREAIAAGLCSYEEIGAAGYLAAYGVAADNLSGGRAVIADSVNPIHATRSAWRAVAEKAAARLCEIEVVCSNVDEHRRRVEERVTDVEGLRLPTWEQVLKRQYEPWPEAHRIDTAQRAVDECVEELLRVV